MTMKTSVLLIVLAVLANFGCSNSEGTMKNPLLTKSEAPFGAVQFDQIEVAHFKPAFDSAFAIAYREVDAITNNAEAPTFENTILALENAGELLGECSKVLFNLNSAETNDDIQALAREMSPRLTQFKNDVLLNENLFARIKELHGKIDELGLNEEQKQLLNKKFDGFARNGANLSEADKEEYRAVTEKISSLSVQFGEFTLAETNDYFLHITKEEDLAGLPEDVIAAAKKDAEERKLEGWVITLQFPSFGPFLKYADNRELRKEVYLAYNTRGLKDNDNNTEDIIRELTALRLQKARLLGYNTYADFILSDRMAESADKVNIFLNTLLQESMPAAQQDLKEIEEFAVELGANHSIEAWDWSYYSEKLKKARYDIDDEAVRPYFELSKVRKATFDLSTQLFGITFKKNEQVPVYHPDVEVYECHDENGQYLGLLYMDWFPRESKRGGAWMTEFQDQKVIDSTNHRPHISTVFNFTKPTDTKPSLLTYYEVRTTLHEFGHALHGLLSDVTYSSLSGTNVYRDFVELPSQILENWAEEEEWLNSFAIHFDTGEKMPKEMLDKIIKAKNFQSGYGSVRQLSFGMNDMAWHSITKPYEGSVVAFETEAMAPTALLPRYEGTAMSAAFGHIFAGGYAAGYYGYKWAEVLDADAYSVFKQNGIFDKETAASFREHILSKGSTKHPMELYVAFRGQEPTMDALMERSGFRK